VQGLLDELNKRLDKPLPMNRFRPNIVVTDCSPAAEDGWEEYGIGKNVVVESVKPCDRCSVSACSIWTRSCYALLYYMLQPQMLLFLAMWQLCDRSSP